MESLLSNKDLSATSLLPLQHIRIRAATKNEQSLTCLLLCL
jgi:hypothetical protein